MAQLTKNDPIHALMNKTIACLRAIGIPENDLAGVFAVERGFAIPFAEMQVTLKLNGGERVWECVAHYAVLPITGEKERPITVSLFQEPMAHPQMVARKIALHIATTRIDLTLEALA